MSTFVILSALLVIVGIVLCWIPKRQVSAKGLKTKDRLTLENASRATLAQILGGGVLLVGLYFTAQNLYTTQQIATSNLQQARETRLNERLTRAVDQLGNEQIHVRLGAILALERVARESPPNDSKAMIELLAAYIRDRSPRKQEAESLRGADDDNDPAEKTRRPPSDIQAALAVIGRRSLGFKSGEDESLDLSSTDLRGADLRKANLDRVLLNDANLERANLDGVSLKGASLARVNLREASMAQGHLEAANLPDAKLEGAKLIGAFITETRFNGANLSKANLSQAKGATRSQFKVAILHETIPPEEMRDDQQ